MVYASVDEFTKKKEGTKSHRKWLRRHERKVQRFVDRNISEADREEFVLEMMEHPYIHRQIVEQAKDSNQEKFNRILRKLIEEDGLIELILGGKGSGKTSLAYKIAEEIYERTDGETSIWWLGVPTDLPDFFNVTLDANEIPAGALVIIDESSVQFNARYHGNSDQKDFMRNLPIVRHKDKNYLVISQGSNLTDTTMVTLADGIFFKEYQVLQQDMERDVTIHDDLKPYMPTDVADVLYYDNQRVVSFYFNMARCFSDSRSKPYQKFRNDGEKYRFVIQLFEWLDDPETIQDYVDLRDGVISKLEIMRLDTLIEDKGEEYLLSMSDQELKEALEKGFGDDPINKLARGEDIEGVNMDFWLPKSLEDAFERRFQGDERLELFANRNYNRHLMGEVQDRITDWEGNLVLSVYGQQGTGKSYFAMGLAKSIVEAFGKDHADSIHIYFDVQQILEDLEDMEAGDVVILDEQTEDQGTGSQSSQERLHNAEDTLRESQINFIYCSPQPKTHSHYFLLESYGMNKEHRVNRALIWTPSHDLLGYVTADAPSEEWLEKVGYKEQKREYLERVKSGEATGKQHYIDRAIEALNKKKWRFASTKSKRLSLLEMMFPDMNKGELETVHNMADFIYSEIDPDDFDLTTAHSEKRGMVESPDRHPATEDDVPEILQ